jgi:hypothetical protein
MTRSGVACEAVEALIVMSGEPLMFRQAAEDREGGGC